MTNREGNLEAPTRHPLNWRDPSFYDEGALEKEIERVFDICHGCRRCFSLCNSFPTLFDAIDAREEIRKRAAEAHAHAARVADLEDAPQLAFEIPLVPETRVVRIVRRRALGFGRDLHCFVT